MKNITLSAPPMLAKQNLLKKLLILAGLLFFCPAIYAQSYQKITFKIDSFVNVGLPQSALAEVKKLDELARAEKNAPMQVKAAIYRMTFQSYIEENSLVSIIDTLQSDVDRSVFPVKPVLQSVLAGMYYQYYQQNRWRMVQRTTLEKKPESFLFWDIQTLFAEVASLYERSLHNHEALQAQSLGILDDVLTGDKETRYLRPTLYDLLLHRALDFFLNNEASMIKPKQAFSINDARFFSDSKTFASLPVNTSDTSANTYKGIKLLQGATSFHLRRGDEESLADLDIRRMTFLRSQANFSIKDSLYIKALQQIAGTFADRPITADALFLLGQYFQQKDSLLTAMQYFQKAVSAFPETMGGKNAAVSIKQIRQQSLSVVMEDTYSPGKPLLARVNYKNVNKVNVAVYKLNVAQVQVLKAMDIYYSNPRKYRPAEILNFFGQMSPVQNTILQLPNPQDYRRHATEFKLDGLATGSYVLFIKETNADTTLMHFGNFKVSGLAYMSRLNPDDRIQLTVTGREDGRPLNGVKIFIKGKHHTEVNGRSTETDVSEKGTTKADGSFITNDLNRGAFSAELTWNGDTLSTPDRYVYGQLLRTDDEGRDKTIIFTDRQIYRPGQTIYFKVLEINTIGQQSHLRTYNSDEIALQDANNKTLSTIKFKTSDFGTFSGSFVLPQNILDGEITLSNHDGELNVRVEEYKRPSFQVEFSPVKETYKIGDSVTVKGRVTAFSGYGLSKAKVAFHIGRTQRRRDYNEGGIFYMGNSGMEIATDTVITDDQGNYTIKFRAVANNDISDKYYVFNYAITADVTDAAGETRSTNTTVKVADAAFNINAFIPDKVKSGSPLNIVVSLLNLNDQQLAGHVKIAVYALQSPKKFFKERFWPKPDQYLLSRNDYQSYFTDYAYGDEDDYKKNAVLAEVKTMELDAAADSVSLTKLGIFTTEPSTLYKIKISAADLSGDTVSTTNYISVTGEGWVPKNVGEWAIPVGFMSGKKITYLAGATGANHILMEKYNGAEIVESRWLHFAGTQYVELPIGKTERDIKVQFLMISKNRVYTYSQNIDNTDLDKTLNIDLATFRNKLQPGEKEQWKLRITGSDNEKQNAELLAALYDASLDNIAPPQRWDKLFEQIKIPTNYFNWSDQDLFRSANTRAVKEAYYYYDFLKRRYEELDMAGYNYYGNYNQAYQAYQQKIKYKATLEELNKKHEAEYDRVSALIKNGYLVSGKVTDDKGEGLPGVAVKIKGTGLMVATNVEGYFRIKVPVNGTIVITFIGFKSREIKITKNDKLDISLRSEGNELNEVVIVGYGTQKRTSLTGAVSTVNAIAGRTPGIRVSGKDYTPIDIRGYSNLPADILEKVQVVNAYGTGKPIATRKNFAETAFFYPELHTGKKGEVTIDFTIPESLTKWRFKAFAHTTDLKTGYIEREIVTQKQLSISANMPRFFREGDTIIVSARLANLTAAELKGKVSIELFNALNMQPLALLMNKVDAQQNFSLAAASTGAVKFTMVIPADVEAISYRLVAGAGRYSDGEENTIPVLPNRMLVTESMPMMVRAGQQKTFTFDKLLNQSSATLKNKTLTLEYTQNPAWYAVQALPYMMEFPYECSEQVFSRYYANSLATDMVNQMPLIKTVFERWKAVNSTELLSNLEKNQELKSTLLEETPWLRDAANETEQKKRIALLFDLNKMSYELQLNLEKLQKKQLSSGAFPWFGGNYADRYITQHVLAGIGQLYHLGIADAKNEPLKAIADKGLNYMESVLIEDANRQSNQKIKSEPALSPIEIHCYYTESYYPGRKMSPAMQQLLAGYLKQAATQWNGSNVYEQGMIALTMLRNKKPDVAQTIIRSLLETAQRSDDMGMYWARNQSGYYWYQSPVETQSLMIELFTEAGNNAKAVEDMKIWLLRNKQTSDWKTTKATAAACYALLLKSGDWLADKGSAVIKLDGKELAALKPDSKAEAGTGYIKTSWADEQVKPALGKIDIANNSKTISWGALHWQYLENLDKITSSKTDIKLERRYFIQRQTATGPVLTAVDATHQPKTGDLLKVVVYLKAGRDFEYVQLKDMRPAGTEPVDALSAYKYQDGLYYYQVTKDVATNFFISNLNKGNYVFEYSLRVAQPGNFSTGISTVQSMYAPEFNAHSEGARLTVKPD